MGWDRREINEKRYLEVRRHNHRNMHKEKKKIREQSRSSNRKMLVIGFNKYNDDKIIRILKTMRNDCDNEHEGDYERCFFRESE